MSLTLNKNLEMIKLSQEDVSKGDLGQKFRPLAPISQVVTAKKKVLKEIESTVSVNTQIIGKHLSLIADPERVLVVWIEGHTSHSIVRTLNRSIMPNSLQAHGL